MLKVGGLCLYSTCSLNPIEDEAVVTEAFTRSGMDGSLELVDINNLEGFKTRRGLASWKVLCSNKRDKNATDTDYFTEYKNFEDAAATVALTPSMFNLSDDVMTNKVKI